MTSVTGKILYLERKFSTVDIAKKLGIPMERLRGWMHQCFGLTDARKATGAKTRAMFNITDAYGIALFEYLVQERLFSLEKAAKFTNLWIETNDSPGSDIKNVPMAGEKSSGAANVLIFINLLTPSGKKLICEPVGIFGSKESEGGFHFFKALGVVLRAKLEDRSWDDFWLVNIGKIKRRVDAQLS